MIKPFTVATLSQITLAHPGLAVATLRAGGIALLDLELCRPAGLADVRRHLQSLLALERAEGLPGLRLLPEQIPAFAPLLADLAAHDHWLVVADASATATAERLRALPASERRQLWAEVSTAEAAAGLDPALGFAGLVARGQECGGPVSGDPAFILAQKLAAAGLAVPFFVQGGVGPHTAAACRVAGAAGVVLDDQLWLMPESPLPERWRQHLEDADGQEAAVLGEDLGVPCRVFLRRDLAGACELQRIAEELARDPRGLAERQAEWRRALSARLGWGSPQESAWPAGQGIGLASLLRKRYRTTGRLIRAILAPEAAAAQGHLAAALEHAPLGEGSPLALSHGTRYPLVQGPMTRVSDSAAFAASVADAGALPLLALALMREEPTRVLLQETRDRLAGRPWGVGILGFVTAERRDEQLRAIAEVQPPFALIAGGRPDQAAALEARGVATYLHVPVPGLLRRCLDQGCRRFVFEGRECGGHVGPLSSFALWEAMVETLLDHAPARALPDVHVLLAGGLHDALSGAMASAATAPLAARGVKVGALLGTAYLFTGEAVATGAITAAFQREALACGDTVELKTGGGHTIRCAPTPYAKEFQALRGRLLREGMPADRLRETLDDLNLGRSRIASKGEMRAADGAVARLDPDRQRREGMYMMGRLATLRREVTTMAALHAEVAEGSRRILAAAAADLRVGPRTPRTQPAGIAVVGLACLVPGARDVAAFWRNLLDKTEVVTEVPRHRWDWRVLYSADPKEPDRTASKWGGFSPEVPLDPLRYGIPPNSMKSLSTAQLLTLEVVRWAFSDAGYEGGDFDRENTAVIVGTGANGDLEQHYLIRSALPFLVENPTPEMWKRLPEWTEESFAGVLPNVTAGRVANRFDLGGANYTVDSACASSLTVIDLAISELRTGRSNMVVATGMDFEQTPYFYQGFSRVQAVSPTGVVRSFDQDADGIVISEGVVVVLLKRLADAERDGDKVYAVIQSAAGSSDGKGLGMTAPRSIGQRRALRRAYEEAGCSPATIGLYEAHGTGTPVGDRAELETVVAVLEEAGAAPQSCAVGSVKSLIGHTKAAAGMVGLAKAVLALHHRTLPPHAHVERPLPALADPDKPVCLLREARPWLAPADGAPRRAGVSAFGFGGTNFHAVLEEYRGGVETPAPGGDLWPWELVVLRAAGRDSPDGGLAAELRRLADLLAPHLAAPEPPRLADLAYTLALRAEERRGLPVVLAFAVDSLESLRDTALRIAGRLESGAADPVGPQGHLSWQRPAEAPKLAVLFPGQGSQAPDMAREAVLYLPELRRALELADRVTAGCFDRPLSRLIFPPAAFGPEEEQAQRRRLDDTHAAQPAIGAVSAGLLDFVLRLGLAPDLAAGHSYGELTALHAAGVLSREDLFRLSELRGRLMADAPEAGAMAAVQLAAEQVEPHLATAGGVVIANRNAPDQCVISGPRAAVEALSERLAAEGARVRALPVSSAFHSPLMAAAERPLAEAITASELAAPALPVYGNATAAPYPADPAGVKAQLAAHLQSPVDFTGQVRRMYRDGARVFLELGPGRVLTGLVQRILAEGERFSGASGASDSDGSSETAGTFTAVALDGGLKGLLQGLGHLLAAGLELDLQALFAGRKVRRLDLDARPAALSASTWLVDGGRVRRPNEPMGTMGQLPLLDLEAIEQARSRAEQEKQPAPPAWPPAPVPFPAAPGAMAAAAPAPPSAPPAAGASLALEAYRAYQDTMRQFLALQENVMARVLGQPAAALPGALPLQMPVAAYAPPALQAPGGNGHGMAPLPDLHTPAGAPFEPLVQGVLGAAVSAVEVPAAASAAASPGGNGHERLDTPPAPAAAPARLDRAQLTATVMGLVSERTGYPAEMLDLKQDIEADLGIDSIKRIEILDAFRKNLPEQVRAATEGRMEDLVREKSLGGWVDTVLGLASTGPEAGQGNGNGRGARLQADAGTAGTNGHEGHHGPDGNGSRSAPEPAPGEPCPRYVIRSRGAELAGGDAIVPRGLFLITADTLGVAPLVAAALRERGVPVAVLDRAALASPGESDLLVPGLVDRHGPVQGVVHLAPLDPSEPASETGGGGEPGAGLDAWRCRTQAEVKSLFDLLRLTAPGFDAVDADACVLGATLLGGAWGRSSVSLSALGVPDALSQGLGSPASGGVYGLLKTLKTEHPRVHARAIDFDGGLAPERMAEAVLAELLARGDDFEVGYPGGRRTVFTHEAEPAAPLSGESELADLQPRAGWVVLVTGGARGITAELAQRLAAPGVRMVVVGRSPLPGAEAPEIAALADAAALRTHLLAEVRAAGETVTPAAMEERVRAVLRQREMRRNLAALAAGGAEVEYVAADAARADGLGRVIAEVYARHGRIDAVLHGAGIIEDRLLRDKTRDSFERVFDTKADSTFLLSRALRPASLRWVVLMSSIAGRIGNRGQIDYAAANEVMNRLAWEMSRRFPAARVVAINWGPWSGAGMANEGVIRELAARGIRAIHLDEGWRFLRSELAAPHGAVEVIAGSGA